MTQASSHNRVTGNRLVFQDSIEVNAAVGEVYRQWMDLTSFPDFMSTVEQVTPLGDDRFHWVARILGVKQEWDAQITDLEPDRRIAWRSVAGAPNAGTVTFISTASGSTMVRVRLEYAPPTGNVGVRQLQMSPAAKREVHADLETFKQHVQGGTTSAGVGTAFGTAVTSLVAGAANQAAQATALLQQLQQEYAPDVGDVIGLLPMPLAAGVAGGIAAYAIGQVAHQRTAGKLAVLTETDPIALPTAVAGWALSGASVVSALGAATLRARGNLRQALFMDQWAPTLLGGAIFARLIGDRRPPPSAPASATSWACVAAALGTVGWSALLHSRGRQQQGVFVGQLAPTLMGAAILTRLVGRHSVR